MNLRVGLGLFGFLFLESFFVYEEELVYSLYLFSKLVNGNLRFGRKERICLVFFWEWVLMEKRGRERE